MATRSRPGRWTQQRTTLAAAIAGLSALAGLCAAPRPAAAAELRFVTTAPGGIVATGNTLGLSKELNANGPGTRDSIGTFLSLANTVDDMPPNAANPWPMGTTADWTQNGSAADLTLPLEHQVLYAELIWGGSYNYGGEDVTALLDTPVTLSFAGDSMAVSPDTVTAVTIAEIAISGFPVNYYIRSADVTAFVQAHGAGTYAVRGVPATQIETINSLNAAGWTLVVAHRDTSLPVRNMSIFVGGDFVDEDTVQDYEVSGFCAPPSGAIEGKVAISAIEGDANLTGDQLLIAPTVADTFVNLAGPNNPEGNFFCSQLNDPMGNLDVNGTFGNANHDAIAGVNAAGGRQGWDVTSVPVSSMGGQLVAGQTSAVMRTVTTGDSFLPALAAFEIDVNAPNFTEGTSSITTSADVVRLGDALTVTVTLGNQGQAAATLLSFTMPLADGLALSSYATDGAPGDASGNAVTAADLSAGVDAGELAPGETRTVVLELDVSGPPTGLSYLLQPVWSYTFVTCEGEPPLTESYVAFARVDYDATGAGGAGGGGGAGGAGGGTPTGGGGQGGTGAAPADGDGSSGDSGSCGCTVPGEERPDGASALGAGALLLSLAAALRRRRRSGR